jgi:hypothetical protein
MRRLSLVIALAVAATPALAEDKKKKDSGVNIDDLFGAPPAKGGNLDAMKKATEGMGNKTGATGLAPKVDAVDSDAGVTFTNVFAAEKINEDKKLGCQPAGRDKKKVVEWTFDEVPAKAAQGFEVCLTMTSKAGREMNMSVSIVDSRNQKVAKAEDVVDFRGRTKIDHVLEYPAPTFKMVGPYFYVVDLDGKEAGRLPLFVVKVDGSTSGTNGSANPAGSPADPSAPVTAKEPDAT